MNETLPIAIFCIFLLLSAVYPGLLYLGRRKQESQAKFMIAQAAAINSYRKSLPELQREVARARRSERPLSVVVVRPLRHNGSDDNQLSRIEFLLCGRIFRDAVRELDFTTYDGARDQFIIVLPESTESQTRHAIERLSGLVGKAVDHLSFSAATFPEDGLTVEDLVVRAKASESSSITPRKVDEITSNAQAYASR